MEQWNCPTSLVYEDLLGNFFSIEVSDKIIVINLQYKIQFEEKRRKILGLAMMGHNTLFALFVGKAGLMQMLNNAGQKGIKTRTTSIKCATSNKTPSSHTTKKVTLT